VALEEDMRREKRLKVMKQLMLMLPMMNLVHNDVRQTIKQYL
jgi:hypothetical protein